MTVNALQQKIVTYLTGLSSKGYTGVIDARVEQPVAAYAKVDTPLIFVWGATANESRLAIPRPDAGIGRGPGWKQDAHKVSLWLFGLALANDPDRAWKFPVLIQTVRKALAGATPMPVELIDPQTTETSFLMDLGEEMTWDYDIDRSLADQRLVRNICRLDVSAMEAFQA